MATYNLIDYLTNQDGEIDSSYAWVIAFRGLADELLKSNSLTDEQIDALLKVQEVFA